MHAENAEVFEYWGETPPKADISYLRAKRATTEPGDAENRLAAIDAWPSFECETCLARSKAGASTLTGFLRSPDTEARLRRDTEAPRKKEHGATNGVIPGGFREFPCPREAGFPCP